MGDGLPLKDDYEPGLSHSGILETLEYVKVHRNDFKSCDVCVSNLYRTWCTAVILYGNGYKEKEKQNPDMMHYLNLWICPYLKEHYPKTSLYKRGNAPRPMKEMAKKFKIFLDTLMIIIDNDKYKDFHFPSRIYLNLSLSVKKEQNQESYIIYKKGNEENEYNYDLEHFVNNNYYTDKTYKFTLNEKWMKTGNLTSFMTWFTTDFYEEKNFNTEKVHVVTHSNVMQNYLKELSLNKLKKKYDHEGRFCFKKSHKSYYTKVTDKNIDFIGKTNCWSFETKLSFLSEIQDYFNKNNSLSKKISDILSNKISIHDMIIELNQYDYGPPIKHLISILSSIKMGVIKRHDANQIESQNKGLSLCGKFKQTTKKGGKLKRNKITRKRRNARTRKKSFVKRGGCYRETTIQEKMENHINNPNTQTQINEIYPPWDEEKVLENAIKDYYKNSLELEKAIKEIKKMIKKYDRETIINPILSREKQTWDFSDDDISEVHKGILQIMSASKATYDSLEANKDEILYFVKTYPYRTYFEYLAFSHEKDNLSTFHNMNIVTDQSNNDIFILDTNGQPFPKDNRYTLPDERRVKLWNILHINNPELLIRFTNKEFDIKKSQVKTNPYNPQLKQNIEEYIKYNSDKTYEDWIQQDDIFKKYVIDDSHIFSIMYLKKHPALHYWNESSNNRVTHRTKVNEDPYKPNDPNIYVYEIPNNK